MREEYRKPRHRAARLALAVGVILVSLVLLGCGSDDESSDGGNGDSAEAFPPNVVRDSEIEAQDEGSPERALLEWWQAFQFGDARAVVAATSPATVAAIGRANLVELVKTRGPGLQGLEVLGGGEQGSTASVRAGLLTFESEKEGAPVPTTPTASRPVTFAMRSRGGEWLFNETAFLEPMLQNLEQSQQQQQQQQEQAPEGQQTEE